MQWFKSLHALAFIILLCRHYSASAKKCKYQEKKIEKGRKCRKPCKDDSDCGGHNRTCNCDDTCGMTCFNFESECRTSPEEIENGFVQYKGIKYGSKAIYSCEEGYKLVGDKERTCRSDRVWSGNPPWCEASACNYPPRITSAFHNSAGSHFGVGDVVTYQCRDGLILSGNPSITCHSNKKWSSFSFVCVEVNCGEPEKPRNGYFEGTNFSFGSWITYHCDKGYDLEEPDTARRYCSATGIWSGKAAKCLTTFCPDIEPIQHGDARSTSRPPYRNGAIVTFTCDRGFKGNGLGSITCSNGRWSNPVPYCAVIRCRRNLKKVEEGRTCRKSCKSDIDCKSSFKKCLCDDWCGKTCFNPDATCPQLTAPENGYIIQSEISYGYTMTYGCDEGYVLTGRATRRCQANKKWSGHEPKCVEFATCGKPGDEDETLFKGRVIEGKDASEGAWPWQALLFNNFEHSAMQIYNRENGFGGGSIIDDEWILTAAHIFKKFPNIDKNENPEAFFLITVGLTTFPEYGQVLPEYVNIFEPKKVYINENYNSENFDYDVALIRIGKRLKQEKGKFVVDQNAPDGKLVFSRYIRPVCLPCTKGNKFGAVDSWKNFDKDKCNPRGRSFSNAMIKAGEFVMVTGFGWKRNPGANRTFLPKKLQEGLLKIADDLLCIKRVQEIRRHVFEARYTDRMLCARSAEKNARTDSCHGDSGGPLVKQIDISDHLKYWIQVGIVSWGGECGTEFPGYYTSVMTIMPWVWKVIDEARIE